MLKKTMEENVQETSKHCYLKLNLFRKVLITIIEEIYVL